MDSFRDDAYCNTLGGMQKKLRFSILTIDQP